MERNIERMLLRQESRAEILNLMGRYQYYHSAGQMSRIGRELFAFRLPDAHSEYGGLGVFGPEKSLRFFDCMRGNKESLTTIFQYTPDNSCIKIFNIICP